MALQWYVVHAYSNFEHKVKESLIERVRRAGLQERFGEILVPTEEVVEMREGQRRKSERKFFPGYVLVQMEMDDETWHLVKEVPKVLGFIGGSSDRPAPITDKEAQAILNRVQEGVDKPRPKVLFEPGEVVRVTEGPFNDFSGVVENVNYEKSKVRVAVQILGSLDAGRARLQSSRKSVKQRATGVWHEKSKPTSSCKSRPARRTRARPSDLRSASTASTSWSSARRSTRRLRAWRSAFPFPS